MKPNDPFTLELKEGGDKDENVWESREGKARFPRGQG